MRVARVRTVRIAPQIGPVGGRRIDDARSPPCDCLASRRNDGAHPPGHGIAGISSEKVGVSVQRVALQRRDIRLLRVKIANWPCADRGALFSRNGGRWGIGGSLEEHEGCRYLGGMPWHLGALGNLVDTESCAFEDVGEGQAAFADHLSQRLGIGSIGALTFRSHRSGRRIEGDQHAWLGFDQGQAAGEGWTGTGE